MALATEAVEDPFVRKLMAKLSGPEAKVEINIEKPTIYITSVEKNFDKFMNSLALASAYKQDFINEGFEITDIADDANTSSTTLTNKVVGNGVALLLEL